MQNKSAVLIFTVLLALATLYTLSFNYFSSEFEKEATEQGVFEAEQLLQSGDITEAEFDATASKEAKAYLRAKGDSAIVPVFGQTYREAKEQELNAGRPAWWHERDPRSVHPGPRDRPRRLQHQRSVSCSHCRSQRGAQVFQRRLHHALRLIWATQGGDVELWRIFHNMENRDLFPQKSTDEEILAILRAEAETAINNTKNIIRKRIDQLGVAQPNVQKLSFSGRILVELPGIDDPARARKQLKSTANLEFWETFFTKVAQRVANANIAAGQAMRPDLYAEGAAADTSLSIGEPAPRTRCLPSSNRAHGPHEHRRIQCGGRHQQSECHPPHAGRQSRPRQ